MEFKEYVETDFIMLIPVLYLVGIGIKKSRIQDRWIPVILGLIAITLVSIWIIATRDMSCVKEYALALYTSITQGILVAGASVYANQVVVQLKKKDVEESK